MGNNSAKIKELITNLQTELKASIIKCDSKIKEKKEKIAKAKALKNNQVGKSSPQNSSSDSENNTVDCLINPAPAPDTSEI